MNTAAGSVVTGLKSRTAALRTAIKQFANDGVTAFYDKAGRAWTPEAYINMDIRTTVTNTAHAATFARCDDYGVDLIEITSHAGARPKCAIDQGKLFNRANKSGTTTDLHGAGIPYHAWNTSSYGQLDGILGINCGHFAYPFFEGLSIKRNEETQDFEENARQYKDKQTQRRYERETRSAKREAMAAQASGDEEAFEKASAKVKNAQAKYDGYCEENGLTPHDDRMQVVGYDKKTAADVTKANNEYVAKQKAKNSQATNNLTNVPQGDIINIDKIKSAYGDERAEEVAELLRAAPHDVCNVWNKYANEIKFSSIDYKGTANYNPSSGGVSIDLVKDLIDDNSHARYSTTFHEIAHLIDDTSAKTIGSYFGTISEMYQGGIFSQTLKTEADAYTKVVYDKLRAKMVAQGRKASIISISSARSMIELELLRMPSRIGGDVSDIFGGATMLKIKGVAGHPIDYWKTTDVSVEAFAEMFSATVANPQSVVQIQKYFPKSYDIFLQMLKIL
jgi:hypothetical protein